MLLIFCLKFKPRMFGLLFVQVFGLVDSAMDIRQCRNGYSVVEFRTRKHGQLPIFFFLKSNPRAFPWANHKTYPNNRNQSHFKQGLAF